MTGIFACIFFVVFLVPGMMGGTLYLLMKHSMNGGVEILNIKYFQITFHFNEM
jgi:hypothetical protein